MAHNEVVTGAAGAAPVNKTAAPAGDGGISILDILQVVAENLRLLILLPLALGLIALGITFLIKPSYTAVVKFLPPQQQASAASSMLQSLGALGGLAGAASGLKNPADQYVAFLKTNTVRDALVDRFQLMDRYQAKLRQDARSSLTTNTKIQTGKENIISIDVDDADPKFAADLANAYVEELGAMLNVMAVTEAQQRRIFFEKQLGQAKDNLIKAEQTLAASGISVSALNANPGTAFEGPARVRAQVTAQEVKIASMRSYLTPSAPEYRQAVAELNALRSQLKKAEEQQQPASGSGGTDYIANYREFKYQEALFELFSKQFEVAKIDESREGAVIQVVDKAQVPETKSKPKKALIAVGVTLVSGFLLLIFVFLRHAMRAEARNPASAHKMAKLRSTFGRAFGRR